MGENHRRPSSRLGLKIAGGEIVEVEGGHIVRSTGRKDRHSKVCTAKGARDRRVRLSAHTAIQFYDVQDRLGYDRPSKAVDWLINKAKNAIDELAVLPPWHPTATTANAAAEPEPEPEPEEETVIRSSKRPISVEIERSGCDFQHQEQFSNNPSNSSSFLPHFLDSDTIKPFFPMAASATFSSSIHFQNYPLELLSRNNTQSQDLRLSLHSNQDPVLLHHHSNPSSSSEQVFFSGSSTPLGFDSTSEPGWSEQQQPEMGQFIFNSPPLQPFLGLNPLFSQRGPLQSSNSPSVRAWTDRPIATIDHHQTPAFHQSSISGIGFASGGFSGFRIPARIQGEEEHDAVSNKPSSASRH